MQNIQYIHSEVVDMYINDWLWTGSNNVPILLLSKNILRQQ